GPPPRPAASSPPKAGVRGRRGLAAGELVDLAVGGAEVTPAHAVVVDLAAEQLHAGPLQLGHGGGEALDPEADHRAGGEVPVIPIAGAEHLEAVARGQVEDGEVRFLVLQGQPEDAGEERHHGPVAVGPGAGPADPCHLHARLPVVAATGDIVEAWDEPGGGCSWTRRWRRR